jgi:hypothetical protein
MSPGAHSGFVVVTRFTSEDDANAAARTLVENGVGAIVEDAPPAPPPVEAAPVDPLAAEPATNAAWPAAPVTEPPGRFAVLVLASDLVRACSVLDLPVPEYAAPVDDTAKAKRSDLKKMLIIWAIAMVVIPVAAFYLTYFLTSR